LTCIGLLSACGRAVCTSGDEVAMLPVADGLSANTGKRTIPVMNWSRYGCCKGMPYTGFGFEVEVTRCKSKAEETLHT
jgi:hypothetical protein